MLSETSQSQQDQHCVSRLTRGPQSGHIHRDRSRRVVVRSWGRGKGGLCLMGTELQCGEMNTFWRGMGGDSHTAMSTY